MKKGLCIDYLQRYNHCLMIAEITQCNSIWNKTKREGELAQDRACLTGEPRKSKRRAKLVRCEQ